MIFPNFMTNRVILRQINPNDLYDLHEIYTNENIMRYFGSYPLSSLNETMNLINYYHRLHETDEAIRWGIYLKNENKLIGTCGFHNRNKGHSRIEMGYELNEKYWHKGYMKEALLVIINYAFNYLNVHRIEALVYPENLNSEKLLLSLGFTKEGVLKDYAYFRDRFTTLNIFSLINN